MKIDAHSRLHNVVTANLQEDVEIQKFLKSMARRFRSQVHYINYGKAVLKSKYGSLAVVEERGIYAIDFRFRRGPVSIIVIAEGKNAMSAISRFHREVSVEIDDYVLRANNLIQEAKEMRSAALEANDLIL